MVKLTVVPVIPLALSEAMKTAMFAISSSVMSRRAWVLLARNSCHCSQVIPDESGAGDSRPDHQGAGRGWRGVQRADRAAPSRATGALLSDARIVTGRRGRPTGHAAGRLAGSRRVRGTRLVPHLALPDRHQQVPQHASVGQPAPGPGAGPAPG